MKTIPGGKDIASLLKGSYIFLLSGGSSLRSDHDGRSEDYPCIKSAEAVDEPGGELDCGS